MIFGLDIHFEVYVHYKSQDTFMFEVAETCFNVTSVVLALVKLNCMLMIVCKNLTLSVSKPICCLWASGARFYLYVSTFFCPLLCFAVANGEPT